MKEIRSLAKLKFIGIWNSDIDKIVIKRTSFRGMKSEASRSRFGPFGTVRVKAIQSFKSTTGRNKVKSKSFTHR